MWLPDYHTFVSSSCTMMIRLCHVLTINCYCSTHTAWVPFLAKQIALCLGLSTVLSKCHSTCKYFLITFKNMEIEPNCKAEMQMDFILPKVSCQVSCSRYLPKFLYTSKLFSLYGMLCSYALHKLSVAIRINFYCWHIAIIDYILYVKPHLVNAGFV